MLDDSLYAEILEQLSKSYVCCLLDGQDHRPRETTAVFASHSQVTKRGALTALRY